MLADMFTKKRGRGETCKDFFEDRKMWDCRRTMPCRRAWTPERSMEITRDEFRPKKVLWAVKQDAFKSRLVETAVAFVLHMNACAFVRDSRIGTVILRKRAPVFLLENNSRST